MFEAYTRLIRPGYCHFICNLSRCVRPGFIRMYCVMILLPIYGGHVYCNDQAMIRKFRWCNKIMTLWVRATKILLTPRNSNRNWMPEYAMISKILFMILCNQITGFTRWLQSHAIFHLIIIDAGQSNLLFVMFCLVLNSLGMLYST